MAIDLATLAALGILPGAGPAVGSIAANAPSAIPQLGQSIFPVQSNGVDPLAPLAAPSLSLTPDSSNSKSDSSNNSDSNTPSFGQPWKSDAMLALGAGLLSGDNFFDGLAKGAMAAQQARHAYENPKRNLVANGAFTLEQYPDGSTKLVPNKQIQDYNTQQTLLGYEGRAALQAQNAKAIADRMDANNKAEAARVQAQIDASDRRAAAQLQETERYHTQDLKVREDAINGKETPYQIALDQNQAKQDVALPAEIQQDQDFSNELSELADLVKSGKTGIGAGTTAKAARAMARVVPSAGEAAGIDIHSFKRAEQIIKHINMIATRQWLKGMGGSRLTNYDLKLASAAQPNMEMDPKTLLESIARIKRITDLGIQTKQQQLQIAKQRSSGTYGGNSSPVTSGTTSGGISWKIVP